MTEVDGYSIKGDKWFEAPSLNKERADASSCEQGDFIYTFGGLKYSAGFQLADIERLNVTEFTRRRINVNTIVEWEQVQI